MRIALVNDLVMAVESLRRIILSVPGHEIVWVAHDGREAVEKSAADPPDLILMDLIMPVMDGVEATRRIMLSTQCAILIVTATVGNNAAKVFEAMGHGALDAVNIPMMGSGAEAQRSRYTLLRKIHIISRLRGMRSTSPVRPVDMTPPTPLVVIGASTGGPKALADVLSPLPGDLRATLVIIQHVDEKFSAGLAEWLNGQTPLGVQLAPEGGQPRQGVAYVAGTNDHLIFTPALTFSYTPDPGATSYRPSVDVCFDSLVRHMPQNFVAGACMAILLTGMGRDGAEGLLALRRTGWHTVAQDRATSVVYGMPKAARDLDAVDTVLPLQRIGPAIAEFVAAYHRPYSDGSPASGGATRPAGGPPGRERNGGVPSRKAEG